MVHRYLHLHLLHCYSTNRTTNCHPPHALPLVVVEDDPVVVVVVPSSIVDDAFDVPHVS